MTNKLNISLIITVATILLSVGGSFAVMKSKTDKIDKLEEIVITNDKKMGIVETKLTTIDDNIKEQKENFKELKSDLKEILKAVKR